MMNPDLVGTTLTATGSPAEFTEQRIDVRVDQAGPAKDTNGRAVLIDCRNVDRVSLSVTQSADGAPSAVLEPKKTLGDNVRTAFGSPPVLNAANPTRFAIDVSDTPYLELDVTTAEAGKVWQIRAYGYRVRS